MRNRRPVAVPETVDEEPGRGSFGGRYADRESRSATPGAEELKDNEFGALASFVFNVGKDNFARSTLLALINQGYPEAASKEFGKWVISDKKVLPGLVKRRSCEAALFRNQVKPNAAGEFSRSDCETLGAAPAGGTLIDVVTGKEVQTSGAE